MTLRITFNPFPPLIMYSMIRVSATSLTAGSSPSDRPRTTVGRVWTGTMDNHPKIPTARRRARTLGLGGAPETTVGDVPTAPRGEGEVTGYHARARPCGKLTLTVRHQHDTNQLS